MRTQWSAAVSQLYTSMISTLALAPGLLTAVYYTVAGDSYTLRYQARLCATCYLAIAVAFWL